MAPHSPDQQSVPLATVANSTPHFNPPQIESSRIQDADLLLNLTNSPHNRSSPQLSNSGMPNISDPNLGFVDQSMPHQRTGYHRRQEQSGMPYFNMMIESQNIDMSVLGDDVMWLEYLPSEPFSFYGTDGGGTHGV
jgi:hypothetical protein